MKLADTKRFYVNQPIPAREGVRTGLCYWCKPLALDGSGGLAGDGPAEAAALPASER